MRKLSNTFLTIGGILSFVFVGLFIVLAIVCFVVSSPVGTDLVKDWVANHPEQSDLTPEQAAKLFSAAFVACGILFLFISAFAVPSGIVAFKAKQKPTHGILVANIVFGALSGTSFNIAGGILGLIRNNREERNARNNKVVDNQ